MNDNEKKIYQKERERKEILVFVNLFCNMIESENMDSKILSSAYYDVLKCSENSRICNYVINDLVSDNREIAQKIPDCHNYLRQVFSKESVMNEESFCASIQKCQDVIIKGVSEKKSEEIFTMTIEESKDIIKNNIMDWDYFKTHFHQDFEYWQIKEAIGWIAAYVETEDYEPSDILVYNNGELNKKQTLKKILNNINKKSLKNPIPFKTRQGFNEESEDFSFQFNPARSGEIDVVLWSEKKQKIIAIDVTRDRSSEIEGNQFLRHYVKILAESLLLKTKYKDSKENIIDLSARNFFNSNRFKELTSIESIKNKDFLEENIKNMLSTSIKKENGESKSISNDFLKNLTIVRDYIKRFYKEDFLNNKEISKNEMNYILKMGQKNVEFTFFGELLNNENSFLNELNASLNGLAYVVNFNKISNIKIGYENSFNFLENINFQYNKKVDNHLIKKGIEYVTQMIIADEKSFDVIAKGFSEGHCFGPERENLFKSFQSFLYLLNETDIIKNVLKEDKFEKLLKFIVNNDFKSIIEEKMEKINIAQAETSRELDTLYLLCELTQVKAEKKLYEFLQKPSKNRIKI